MTTQTVLLNKNASSFVPSVSAPEKDELKDIDFDRGLVLTHFNDCNNFSPQEVKDKRGVITNLEGDLVCKTFSFIEEYTPYEIEKRPFLLTEDFKSLRFYESHEGTIIRLYNYQNRWLLSTHKKINAFKSRWGSRESFGQMFLNALISKYKLPDSRLSKTIECENDDDIFDRYCDLLDPNLVYCFLIKNTLENRIVCDSPDVPTILCLGIFDKTGKLLADNKSFIPTPAELTFKSSTEVLEYVNNIYYKKLQGVLVYKPDGNLFKILNMKYNELYNIRGNQPSLKFRYLQVRKQEDLVKKLISLYPYKESRFEFYENNLRMLAQSIHSAYVKRFINKEYIILEKPQYALMMTVHSKYLQNGTKITPDLVYNTINDLEASKLMSLLRSVAV
jgi:hypothetical protein